MKQLRIVDCGLRNERKRTANPESEIQNSKLSGFTLLEVMVAVAILAMVLVTLLGVKNKSMQDVMLADHITTATMLAKRKMNETLVTAATGTIAEKEEEGEFPEDEFKGYAWKQAISYISPMETLKIKEILVQVSWNEGERQEIVELKSYE